MTACFLCFTDSNVFSSRLSKAYIVIATSACAVNNSVYLLSAFWQGCIGVNEAIEAEKAKLRAEFEVQYGKIPTSAVVSEAVADSVTINEISTPIEKRRLHSMDTAVNALFEEVFGRDRESPDEEKKALELLTQIMPENDVVEEDEIHETTPTPPMVSVPELEPAEEVIVESVLLVITAKVTVESETPEPAAEETSEEILTLSNSISENIVGVAETSKELVFAPHFIPNSKIAEKNTTLDYTKRFLQSNTLNPAHSTPITQKDMQLG